MDIVLVGFIVGFIYAGFRSGFLRRLIGLGFIAISFLLSTYLSGPFGDLIHSIAPDVTPAYAQLWAYLLVFPTILVVLHLVIGRLVKNVAVSGISEGLDKALGAVFGALEAILILTVVVIAVDRYSAEVTATTLGSMRPLIDLLQGISTSNTATLLRETTVPLLLAIAGPLLPADLHGLLDKIPNGPKGGIPGFPFPTP